MTDAATKARVFVAERPAGNIDLAVAEEYGELALILEERGYSAFDSTGFVNRVRERTEAMGFDPARDYFCVAGPTATVSLVLSMLFVRYKTVNVLLFNKRTGKYSCRTVNMASMAAA